MLGPRPQISMLKPNPQGGGTWRWGLWEVISHESGALMMGLVSLSKGLQELACAFCPVTHCSLSPPSSPETIS